MIPILVRAARDLANETSYFGLGSEGQIGNQMKLQIRISSFTADVAIQQAALRAGRREVRRGDSAP